MVLPVSAIAMAKAASLPIKVLIIINLLTEN